MVSESIVWAKKENLLYNFDTNEVTSLKPLQLNQIEEYSNWMGDVHVTDQLRGVHIMDRWVRNQKFDDFILKTY